MRLVPVATISTARCGGLAMVVTILTSWDLLVQAMVSAVARSLVISLPRHASGKNRTTHNAHGIW